MLEKTVAGSTIDTGETPNNNNTVTITPTPTPSNIKKFLRFFLLVHVSLRDLLIAYGIAITTIANAMYGNNPPKLKFILACGGLTFIVKFA